MLQGAASRGKRGAPRRATCERWLHLLSSSAAESVHVLSPCARASARSRTANPYLRGALNFPDRQTIRIPAPLSPAVCTRGALRAGASVHLFTLEP
mmetsp:Transcript_19900/g.50620  ORF Transcript_19900/g.50620 Transcript_19900/m.50620 type:complete len:96 (+) Transcript_19900:220-507(+)